MTEELEQLLKNLKLRRMLEIYEEQLRAADKEGISYSDFVTRLVRAQWQAKQEGALEWRIRRANLPERWTLETFPFARQPGVNRKQIRGFAELEFIAKAENIVLVGKTGVGKTGLACHQIRDVRTRNQQDQRDQHSESCEREGSKHRGKLLANSLHRNARFQNHENSEPRRVRLIEEWV